MEPRRQALYHTLGPVLRHTCSLPGNILTMLIIVIIVNSVTVISVISAISAISIKERFIERQTKNITNVSLDMYVKIWNFAQISEF